MYPNTLLFRAERPEDKLALLNAYQRTIDENEDRQDDSPNSSRASRDLKYYTRHRY